MEDKSVRFESDFEQGGFTAVPNKVLTNSAISLASRMTYSMLRFFAWQDESCWPGQQALSELLGCSERSLRGYLTELSEHGLIRIERRGLGRTNVYVLTVSHRSEFAGLDRKQVAALDRKQVADHVEEDSVEEDTDKKPSSSEVTEVFDYWRDKLIHPRSKMDSNRRQKIRARLKDGYSVADLKAAIDGCARSAWNMGENPSNRRFDDIALICRDASKVEGFMAIAAGSVVDNWDKLLDSGRNSNGNS